MSEQAEQTTTRRQRWLKIGLIVGAGVLILEVVLSAALFLAMKQTPVRFATVMSKLPTLSIRVLPFETLWTVARAGDLKVGDMAPDFRLQTYDKTSWVQLSSFRGDRPVVLIFGSYT